MKDVESYLESEGRSVSEVNGILNGMCTFGGVMMLSAVSVGDGSLSMDETVLIPSISSSFCVQSYELFMKREQLCDGLQG